MQAACGLKTYLWGGSGPGRAAWWAARGGGSLRQDVGCDDEWNLDTSCCHSSLNDCASAAGGTSGRAMKTHSGTEPASKCFNVHSSMFWKSWLSSFSPVFLLYFFSTTCPLSLMWCPIFIFSRPLSESFTAWWVSLIWERSSEWNLHKHSIFACRSWKQWIVLVWNKSVTYSSWGMTSWWDCFKDLRRLISNFWICHYWRGAERVGIWICGRVPLKHTQSKTLFSNHILFKSTREPRRGRLTEYTHKVSVHFFHLVSHIGHHVVKHAKRVLHDVLQEQKEKVNFKWVELLF